MTQSTSSFNVMKFRLWRRRMSVSSARMTIKTQLSWPLRIVCGAMIIGTAAAVAMWTYDMGRSLTGPEPADTREQLEQYKEQVKTLSAERDRLSAGVNAAASQINIELSAQKQLALQVKRLEAENTSLKEDLAFFDSLLPNRIGPQGVAIRRMKLDLVAPHQLHYRLLIVQGGQGEQTFDGNLQLAVTTMRDGKSAMMNFPGTNAAEQGKFQLSFRYYQRVEGVLALPPGAAIKTVQARVFVNGQIRAQQSANF